MIANLLNNTVTIQSVSTSSGPNMVEVDNYANAYTNIPCMISSAKTSWIVRYQQRAIDIDHTLYFGSNIVVKAGYRILYNGRIFLVKGIRNPGEWNIMTTVDALEITT